MTLLLENTPTQTRRRFIRDAVDIVGYANVRAFYVPQRGEGLKVPDAVVASRLWTHGTDPGGRIVRHGKLWALTFNGTTDYLTTPDAADVSFGNGTVDSAFSILSVVNITDTAGIRTILSKHTTSNREYYFEIFVDDKLYFQVTDESANAGSFKNIDAVIPAATWQTLGGSYSGVGGASAANGLTLYRNGAADAQTASSNASYVAMENLGAALEIGSQAAHAGGLYQGSLGPIIEVAANLSAAQQAQWYELAKRNWMVA